MLEANTALLDIMVDNSVIIQAKVTVANKGRWAHINIKLLHLPHA